MTQDVQVTVTIPEGYELADTKMRQAMKGEWYWATNMQKPIQAIDTKTVSVFIILRPIAPQYVYPKVRREDALRYKKWCRQHGTALTNCGDDLSVCRESAAIREALEAKGEPQFDPAKHVDPTLGPNEVRLDGRIYKLVEGTPEPVCGKHHHDGWEYRHVVTGLDCGFGDCQRPLGHHAFDGQHA